MDKKIEDTKKWLEEVVVGLNLCPFAKTPMDNGKIDIQSATLDQLDEKIQSVLQELNDNKFETTLLVLDENIEYESFYEICSEIEAGLESVGLLEHFQVVCFHPDFVFDGMEKNEIANLVNRSPYPLIHFLKTSSMLSLNLDPQQGEEISLKNEELLKSMDKERLQALFPWSFKA